MALTSAIVKNYLTTLFGILAGLPLMVAGSGIVLDGKWAHTLLVIGGIGTIGLGLVSKAFNVHSTVDQVESATSKANGVAPPSDAPKP
jgi:hypothetical protein